MLKFVSVCLTPNIGVDRTNMNFCGGHDLGSFGHDLKTLSQSHFRTPSPPRSRNNTTVFVQPRLGTTLNQKVHASLQRAERLFLLFQFNSKTSYN